MGAATGLLLARWGVGTLVRFLAGGQQWILLEPQFDGRVLAFTTMLAVVTGLLFSVVPALQTTRVDAARPDDVGRASTGRARSRVGQTLIVVQVTLSLVLLSGAALFIRTVRNLNTVDAGFSRYGVLTMNVEATLPPEEESPNPVAEHARVASIWGDFLDRIRVMPGVSSAALSTMSPLSRRDRGVRIALAGEPPKAERDMGIHLNHVSADYFCTFGIRLVHGRTFAARDTPASPSVAILNASAARMYFGQASPIGRMVSFPGQRIPDAYQIVGTVEDTRYDDLRKNPDPMAYLPLAQAIDRVGRVIVDVRAPVGPSGVLREVREAARRSVPGSFVGDAMVALCYE